MADQWIVRCRVSGGVTGTRQSVCKSDGKELRFDSEADAQAYADKCYNSTMGSPYRTADFRYWVDRA